MTAEERRLAQVANWYSNRRAGFYTRLVGFTCESLAPHVKGPSGLELGPADGEMTRLLAPHFERLLVVDASPKYIEQAVLQGPNVRGVASLFEEFETDEQFDTIVVAHVLEHLVDPILILTKARAWLAPGGRILIVVPHADSLHRRLGVELGLLEQTTDLNELDVRLGHRRVYTRSLLADHVASAGLTTLTDGGIFLKPLSNEQMSAFDDELVNALYEVGKDIPELCSEIFVVAG